jgi:hypothetical protein
MSETTPIGKLVGYAHAGGQGIAAIFERARPTAVIFDRARPSAAYIQHSA